MLEEYQITPATLAVISLGEDKSMVYEQDNEYIVKRSTMHIINESCKYYGSSYLGRFEGTKRLVGYNYKSPIVVEESNTQIFFPTTSPRIVECSWISLNKIKSYENLKTSSLIKFKNNKELIIDLSYFTLEAQILRANRLWCEVKKREEKMHE